jgi:hypothetical protein
MGCKISSQHPRPQERAVGSSSAHVSKKLDDLSPLSTPLNLQTTEPDGSEWIHIRDWVASFTASCSHSKTSSVSLTDHSNLNSIVNASYVSETLTVRVRNRLRYPVNLLVRYTIEDAQPCSERGEPQPEGESLRQSAVFVCLPGHYTFDVFGVRIEGMELTAGWQRITIRESWDSSNFPCLMIDPVLSESLCTVSSATTNSPPFSVSVFTELPKGRPHKFTWTGMPVEKCMEVTSTPHDGSPSCLDPHYDADREEQAWDIGTGVQ